MKFGKSLSSQIEETIPEWRDKFLSYKDLKKRLKLIVPRPVDPAAKRPRLAADGDSPAAPDAAAEAAAAMTQEEVDFILLLEAELEKFNVFFVEMEEEYIIRQKELQVQMANAKECSEELMRIRKEIVDFHGEMVLLENYSALNYTGLVKILKKYDKRTGALIRLPFIQKVLQEPFFTTETLNKLIKECETMLVGLFPKPPISGSHDGGANSNCNDKSLDGPKDLSEIEYMESLYLRSTKSALRSLKEIRSGSSTVSVFSLPPLQNTGMEESWNKVSSPSLEQTATS